MARERSLCRTVKHKTKRSKKSKNLCYFSSRATSASCKSGGTQQLASTGTINAKWSGSIMNRWCPLFSGHRYEICMRFEVHRPERIQKLSDKPLVSSKQKNAKYVNMHSLKYSRKTFSIQSLHVLFKRVWKNSTTPVAFTNIHLKFPSIFKHTKLPHNFQSPHFLASALRCICKTASLATSRATWP